MHDHATHRIDSEHPDDREAPGTPPLTPEATQAIAQKLRETYDADLREQVPDHLLVLLAKLAGGKDA